jgi:hypothetical protein
MQTATNPQTGEKVQWNGSAWVPASAAPAPAGGPVYGTPPTPKAPDPMEAARLDISRQSQALSQQQAGNQQTNTRLDNIGNMRKEFNALPEVKNYSEISSTRSAAMWKAPNNAQGDLAVIYGFAKVMDPGSVVREGEMDMANSTSSLSSRTLYRRYRPVSRRATASRPRSANSSSTVGNGQRARPSMAFITSSATATNRSRPRTASTRPRSSATTLAMLTARSDSSSTRARIRRSATRIWTPS